MHAYVNVVIALHLSACGAIGADKPETSNTCIADSDMELCSHIANSCETHTISDNCGMQRDVDCGQCADNMGCVSGVCKIPMCTTFNYSSTLFPTFSRAGIQDELGDTTPDGQVILYLEGSSPCGLPHLIVADETTPNSGVFKSQDVTGIFSSLGLYVEQKGYAITADGLKIIALSADRKRLLATKRSAKELTDFTPASTVEFDQLNTQTNGNSATFLGPVISADGLELIYTISGGSVNLNGIYSSVRNSTSDAFPAGTRIDAAMPYPIATGVSSDRLTLFVFDAFNGRVLTRKSTNGSFINPNAPAPPPLISNWYQKPLADCSRLIAVASPGGCQNEDVVIMNRN